MRITIDLSSLDDNFSGIERVALSITKEMIKNRKNSNITFFLIFKNKVHKSFIEECQLKNVNYKVLKGNNKLFYYQVKLPLYLYTHSSDIYLFLAFPSPILFVRKKVYTTIHDLTCFLYPDTMTLASRYYFKISSKKAIYCDNILTVSQTSKNDIIQYFNYKKEINVIYCGLAEIFKNPVNCGDVTKKYNLPEKYILSLSTLEPRKNMRMLVKACSTIDDKLNGTKLVLVGRKGWNLDNVFSDIPKDYLNHNVIFTGFVEEEDLPLIYQKASLFVFPSLYEGFGLPVIEAISQNVDVIVSDIPCLKEITFNQATYFDPNNSEELASVILRKLQNPDRNESLKKSISIYNWGKSAEELIKIFQKGV